MRKQELEQGWRMRCVSEENWQEAKVPGSVYTDLLKHGRPILEGQRGCCLQQNGAGI